MSENEISYKNGITPRILKQLKNDFGLKASKALGQNFLVDQNYCTKIIDLIEDKQSVLEVGPGVGSLTVMLAKAHYEVYAVEYDEHIIEPLNFLLEKFDVKNMVHVEHKDILEVDINTVLTQIASNTVVGNLPYNISATLLMSIAQNVQQAQNVIAMVQKEVGERFCAPLKTRGVSGVTLKSRFYMDCEMCFDVPRNVFVPSPNVDSCVIRFIRKQNPFELIKETDVASYFKLIDAGFSMRRKMLRQSLKPILGAKVLDVLNKSGIDPTLRAEQCDLSDFASIFLASKN